MPALGTQSPASVLPPTKAPVYQMHNALPYQRQATIKLIQERLGAS